MSDNDQSLPPEPGSVPDPSFGLTDEEAGNPSLEAPFPTGDEDLEDDGDDIEED